MPVNYSIYPPNWFTQIRPRILERAGHRCEKCQAANYQPHPVTGAMVYLQVAHKDHDPENWEVTDDRLECLCQRCHLNTDRLECMARRSARLSESKRFGRNYKKLQLTLDLPDQQQH